MALFSNVRVLLPLNGADGSTTITDASTSARTVTVNGNAQIDTAQSKFGGASCLFDGSGDSLQIPSATDLDPGTSDWCIEAWFRLASVGTDQVIAMRATGAGFRPYDLSIDTAGKLVGRFSSNAPTLYSITGTTTLTTGVWHHAALSKNGTTYTLWLNGASEGSTTQSITAFSGSLPLMIGAISTGIYGFDGHIDDFRLVIGEPVYTAPFTPPTSAHPTDDVVSCRSAAPGPLAAPAAVGYMPPQARSAVESPLGAYSGFARAYYASALAAGPLGAALVRALVPPYGTASAPGPLGTPVLLAWHDFTGAIDADAPLRYVCDLVTNDGTVRVPISSWQGTLQTDTASYLQCVIPACTEWVDTITAATEFVISRQGTLLDGSSYEYVMASAEPDTPAFDRGSYNFTCTLSGYMPALTADDDPPEAYDRTLQNVRQTSQSGTNLRIRCDIDLLLRPGHRAIYGPTEFVVRYINYAVNGTEHSMYIGSTSNGA